MACHVLPPTCVLDSCIVNIYDLCRRGLYTSTHRQQWFFMVHYKSVDQSSKQGPTKKNYIIGGTLIWCQFNLLRHLSSEFTRNPIINSKENHKGSCLILTYHIDKPNFRLTHLSKFQIESHKETSLSLAQPIYCVNVFLTSTIRFLFNPTSNIATYRLQYVLEYTIILH